MKMSRRQFVLCAVALTLAAGCARLLFSTAGQQPTKIVRVGYLTGASAAGAQGWVAALREGLRERGYVEGQNLVIEDRYAEGQPSRLPDLVAELIALKVDVLVISGDQAIRTAKDATQTIPIVMIACDAVAAGLIDSLAHPGGNLTGVTCMASTIATKRLEFLKVTLGQFSRAAVLWNSGDPGKAIAWHDTELAGPAVGVQLQSLPVRGGDEFEDAFETATRGRADGMIVLAEGLMNANRKRLAGLALQHRLPMVSDFREFAEDGALMTYGPNLNDMNRYDAYYVDRILRGTKPADLPVEQPMTFDFVVNMKTAQALGISFPNEIMLQVTEVIQ